MNTIQKKHRNIPVFVSHEGCPNACVFCNQKTITGQIPKSAGEYYEEIHRDFSPDENYETQIAFFGGSFTAIDRDRMISLLEMGKRIVDEGIAESIRLSTRPDAVGDEILEILKRYPVKNIELGIQSMSDKVLKITKRGHVAQQSFDAMNRVVAAGFELTGQMMTSLPSSTPEDEIMTAELICKCKASSSRIYPTVVLPGTELYSMKTRGEYISSSLEDTVLRASRVYEVFARNNVRVLRVGLCSNEDVRRPEGDDGSFYHEAIGEHVISRACRNRMEDILINALSKDVDELSKEKKKTAVFYVSKKYISPAAGYKKANKNYFTSKYGLCDIRMQETEEEEALVPENFGIARVQILCR